MCFIIWFQIGINVFFFLLRAKVTRLIALFAIFYIWKKRKSWISRRNTVEISANLHILLFFTGSCLTWLFAGYIAFGRQEDFAHLHVIIVNHLHTQRNEWYKGIGNRNWNGSRIILWNCLIKLKIHSTVSLNFSRSKLTPIRFLNIKILFQFD